MGTPENPSADKFGPPPGQERFEPPKPKARPAWFALAIAVLYLVAKTGLHSWHPTGWLSLAPLAIVVALAIADVVVAKRQRDERESDKPHQHISR